jgi:hypothetical protein
MQRLYYHTARVANVLMHPRTPLGRHVHFQIQTLSGPSTVSYASAFRRDGQITAFKTGKEQTESEILLPLYLSIGWRPVLDYGFLR